MLTLSFLCKKLYAKRKHEYQLHYDRIVFTDGSVSGKGYGGFGVFGGNESEQTVCGSIPFDQTPLNAELYVSDSPLTGQMTSHSLSFYPIGRLYGLAVRC
jgi:hypothetical protein